MISISWAEVAAIISAVSIITGCAATYVRLATVNAVREILNERLKDYMGEGIVTDIEERCERIMQNRVEPKVISGTPWAEDN